MTQILKEVDQQLKDLLQKSYSIALFVGAGTSVESGIGTFRGEGQMSYFEGVPPAYLCTVKALEKSPQLCWKFFNHLYSILQKSKPSSSHQFISSWQKEAERRKIVRFNVITSNFDGLLSRAGVEKVQELYGNIDQSICTTCQRLFNTSDIISQPIPRCECGQILKPNFSLLNDYANEKAYDETVAITRGCQIWFLIGTSGVHKHSLTFTQAVKSRPRATLVEINPRDSFLTKYVHFSIKGKAEDILPQFDYVTA